MTAEVRVRRATPADSRACFDVFLASVTDLTARLGVPWEAEPEPLWKRLEPIYTHLEAHAAEWWVAAERGSGELLGYARSVDRDGLFELSEFFVRPDRQSAGVGRELLARAFPPGRGDVRAIIATTDVRAQARYYASGTAARFPIAALTGTPSDEAPDLGDLEAMTATVDDLAALNDLERTVLEFTRGEEFRWLLSQREGYLYRRDGRPVGYGFVGATGSGPIAALDAADQVPILRHIEARAATLDREELGLEVPMVNEIAIRHLLSRGFKMDQFLTLLMSSRPFGQFDRFIGFAPPFVL